MPGQRIHLLHAGLVVAIGLAAVSGAASAPASASRVAARSERAQPAIAIVSSTRFCCGDVRNELHVVNADGSGRRLLAYGVGLATPSWSPDGRAIAFQGRQVGRERTINVVNADGTGERLLERGGSPAWSPDGTKIAFVRTDELGTAAANSEVYVMSPDGRGQLNLTRHPATDLHPVWSPDGTRIAFVRRTSYAVPKPPGSVPPGPGVAFHDDLYVVRADGSDLRRLTHGLPSFDLSPVWSRDGRTIHFARLVVDPDGRGQRRLPRTLPYTGAWSPDGRKIAFTRATRQGSPVANYDVWVGNADGTGQVNLTRHRGYDGDPAWSPDGRRIAFRSKRDGHLATYVMNADGSGQRRLTHAPADEARVAWSPARPR